MAVTTTALFAFVALSVDLGMLTIARTECQAAADGSALTGCRVLSNKTGVTNNDGASAMVAAKDTVLANNYRTRTFAAGEITRIRLGVYDYNSGTNQFDKPTQWSANYTPGTSSGDPSPGAAPTGKSWTAIEVTVAVNQPTFFAQVLGVTSMPASASALSVHRPRDVAFVLDYSGSMMFGSQPVWPLDVDATCVGLNSPDPHYPQFGHYGRYVHYNHAPNTDSYNTSDSNPANRPNPFRLVNTWPYSDYRLAPSNHTMETTGGPTLADSFWTAVGNPSTISSTTQFQRAFTWEPPVTTLANTATLTPTVHNFGSYLNQITNNAIAVPAPPNYATQSDTPIAYVGDKWPRTDGGLGFDADTSGWAWASLSGSSFTDSWAKTLEEFLGFSGTQGLVTANPGTDGVSGVDGRRIRTNSGSTERFDFSSIDSALYGNPPSHDARDYGNAEYNWWDRIWEQYGYDLDVKDYRTQLAKGSSETRTISLRDSTERFKGYSMGPGYWGKTFFIWPPDPRWGPIERWNQSGPPSTSTENMTADPITPDSTNPTKDTSGRWICDWRRRFFLKSDGTAFNPQSDNVNSSLFNNTTGHVLRSPSGNYRINYAAIMKWIKTGPKVFPDNLRAGRIVYYKSIPDDCTISGSSTTDENLDKRFWREYIHFVLGVGTWDSTNFPLATSDASYPYRRMASVEGASSFLTESVTATANFNPNDTNSPPQNPRPYMHREDSINRPRAHMWFGPLSMIHFLNWGGTPDRPWMAGTLREAQCWQLKAAMSSVLDDMRVNHPNDHCGTAYFANRAHFNVPSAPMGQDWYTLRNALYFNRDAVHILKKFPDNSIEYRPYDSSFANNSTANIMNSSGSTDPNNGFALAYNLLSSSTNLTQWKSLTVNGSTVSDAPVYGNRGRRGASKIVIFETDGVPNATRTWNYAGSGVNTYFTTGSGTAPSTSGISSINGSANTALAIVKMIVASNTANPPGFSYPNSKARVYSIGFGDIFEKWPNLATMYNSGKTAHTFLLDVQKMGNTSGSADTALPEPQIIAGPYQRPNPNAAISATNPAGRIEKLRDALERIMQSGVQVTLIE